MKGGFCLTLERMIWEAERVLCLSPPGRLAKLMLLQLLEKGDLPHIALS